VQPGHGGNVLEPKPVSAQGDAGLKNPRETTGWKEYQVSVRGLLLANEEYRFRARPGYRRFTELYWQLVGGLGGRWSKMWGGTGTRMRCLAAPGLRTGPYRGTIPTSGERSPGGTRQRIVLQSLGGDVNAAACENYN